MFDTEKGMVMASPEEQQRKEAMRKAGQEYFNRILDQAGKGGDPFVRPYQPKHDSVVPGHLAGISEDPDLVAFGSVFEGSKLYVLMAVLVASQASCLVSLKGALLAIPTPGVIAFLHMLLVVVSAVMLSAYDLIERPTLTAAAAKGCAIRAALHGLQTWAAFSALLNGSVYMVLSCICALSMVAEFAASNRLLGISPSAPWLLSVIAGIAGAGLEVATDHHRSYQSAALLLLWALARVAEQAWQHLKHDATGAGYITDMAVVQQVQELAALEQEQSTGTLLFMQHALPALPVLLLGLLFSEGTELVVHEPSVPGLSVLLMSCLLYSVAAHCQAQLLPRLGPKLSVLLQGAAGTGTVVCDFLERAHEMSRYAALGALLAVMASASAAWQRAKAPATEVPPAPAQRPIG